METVDYTKHILFTS